MPSAQPVNKGTFYFESASERYLRREKKAEEAYERIRQDKGDVETIASVSGLSVEEIAAIKSHVFFDKHLRSDATRRRLDVDYDMAVAWNRLTQGIPLERDIILLRHELLENQVEKK